MGSMVMSTFMMFVPQYVEVIFLTILCVGFFGIYIPYQESKKRGETWKPLGWLKGKTGEKKPVHRKKETEFDHISAIGPGRRHRLEQLETMRGAGLVTEQEYRRKRDEIMKES